MGKSQKRYIKYLRNYSQAHPLPAPATALDKTPSSNQSKPRKHYVIHLGNCVKNKPKPKPKCKSSNSIGIYESNSWMIRSGVSQTKSRNMKNQDLEFDGEE